MLGALFYTVSVIKRDWDLWIRSVDDQVYIQMRMPESFKPGKFDIFGSSHQIFHLLVLFATVVHLIGILSAFHYNYDHRTCGVA